MTRSRRPRKLGLRSRSRSSQRLELPVLSSLPVPAYRLPQLVPASGPGPLLRPNPLSDIVDEDVLSLNHLSGCVMQCPFCYARGYPRYRGDTVVVLHTQAAEQVRQQLQQRNSLPRAVYLCPSTDPFRR